MPLTRTAREVNDGMPAFTVDRLETELAASGLDIEDAVVLVLGLTYRPGVAETRASPGVDVAAEARRRGASVLVADPLVGPAEVGLDVPAVEVESIPDRSFDATVCVTPHEEFESIPWRHMESMLVLDGRGTLSVDGDHHRVVTLGGSPTGPAVNDGPRSRTGARNPPSGN